MTKEKQPCWVKEAEQIMPYVKNTLEELGLSYEVKPSGLYLPEGQDRGIFVGDHLMRVVPEHQLIQEFRECHHFQDLPVGIEGFADRAMNAVYLKEGPFCIVFMTAGHELGHILTERSKEEEEKAFSFQLAWQEAAYKTAGYVRGLVMDSISTYLSRLPKNSPYYHHRQTFSLIKSLQEDGVSLMGLYELFADEKVC